MSEHITALNLVLNEVQPKFSSLLRRVSKILKFAKTTKIYLFLALKQRSKILIDINAIFFHLF